MEKCIIYEELQWVLKEDAADHIAELEAENKKLSAFITMEHTDPPYDYGDSQDVQFAIRIAELEAQLAAAQERNVALQSEHLNHVNVLHEQLTAMTVERDSLEAIVTWLAHQ